MTDPFTPEIIEKFATAYFESRSSAEAGKLAFPHLPPAERLRCARLLRSHEGVVERLRQLSETTSDSSVPRGHIAREYIKQGLYEIYHRSMQRESAHPDTLGMRRYQNALREQLQVKLCPECRGAQTRSGGTLCAPCTQQALAAFEKAIDHVQVWKFDAKNALGALEQLGKIEGMFVDRKLIGKLGEDEELAGLSSEEILRNILSVCVEQWGAEHVKKTVDLLAAAETPSPAEPTLQ